MELDPQACQDYLRDYRNYERGKRDEAEYHKFTPLFPIWFKLFIAYALVIIFTGLLMIVLIKQI